MSYESQKTPRGNVGVSCISQAVADAQAAKMDANYCSDCSNCTDCYCCSNCTDCSNCSNCSGCSNCYCCCYCYCCYCCSNCSNCYCCCYCCSNCSNCSGVLGWTKGKTEKLISINGLRWPVASDGIRIQIGCQNHTVEEWEGFSDERISVMDRQALEFWAQFKPTIMAMAKYRATLNVVSLSTEE